jgi:type IV fimbrial biogenesis protein FimT
VHTVTAMHPRTRGFTLVEIMVGLAILSILLAVGVPSMRAWMTTNKAIAASEFYAEGFRLARAEAVKRNAATRLVLTANATSGQRDWQVDLCMPAATVACTDSSGAWSTVTQPNGNANAADFLSINRSADNLPGTSQMTLTRNPADASAVYFTPLGWVNTDIDERLQSVTLAPVTADAFSTTAIMVTLAGVVTKCNPNVASTDSRGCPP